MYLKKLFALIVVSALSYSTGFSQNVKSEITLEDIFKKGTFSARFASPFKVMNNGTSYSVLEGEGENGWKITEYSLESGEVISTIFSSSKLSEKISPESYEFSADESHLLLTTQTEHIYRHSSKSVAYIIKISDGTLKKIPGGKVMYPSLSPDNKRIAYVAENNLFVFDLNTEKNTAITTDGKVNEIINGAVDWVYEEEFSMSKGFEWSPDGKYIAYYKFNESAVKEFSMDWWGNLYPAQERWKYPKAGEDNSKVDVYIHEIETSKNIYCETGSHQDQYLPRIKWTQNPGELSIQRMNRTQNLWELLFFDISNQNMQIILTETSSTYIDITNNLFFVNGENQVLYTSEKNGYNHIYCFDFKKKQEKQITKGNWDVTGINGVDFEKKLIYFTSSEISPVEDHFFVIDFKGKGKQNLTPEPGHHVITMGNGNRYFMDMHSTISAPYKFKLMRTNGSWSKYLETNDQLTAIMEKYNFGSCEFGQLPVVGGQNLNYWIMKPADFDPTKKYPIFMHVYGGPGHNTVRNSYGGRNYLWHQMLVSKGYVVVSVDNRGTGNRGRDFKHSTYLQLGKLELEDQTSAARWFAKQPWADSARIGIWGWSFGGYMSSLCITKSADVFKTAIAVAPVTNWRYYDNIYTERFLRKPQDNPKGYDENSPINYVHKIKGNYLIIHGTGDDNVHFQNTVEMINAMIKSGVKFDSEIYPNRNHGIGDRAAQYHLYRRMTDYVLEKL